MPASIGGLGVAAVVVAGAEVDDGGVEGCGLDVARGCGAGLPAHAVAAANVTNPTDASKTLFTGQAPRPMSA
jgi:hypothetical protein